MYVGIDIGGTNIKGVLTEKTGKIMSFKEVSTPGSAVEFEEAVNKLVETLATSATVSKIDIMAIGVGSAGSIDKSRGMIITSPNIGYMRRYPLAAKIEKITGKKVFIENDATIALIGCWWKGTGSRFRNWIMMTLGTGIGGGVIIDNKIYTGKSGNAMEVGHMIIDHHGRECPCGNTGCLERYASATALVETTASYLKKFKKSSIHKRIKTEELTAKMIFEEALGKDELALKVFGEISYYLGVGVANLVNLFSPEAVIFGGGLSSAHKLILPTVKKIVKERALPGLKEHVQFLSAKNQSMMPALGAAKIAIDSLSAQ